MEYKELIRENAEAMRGFKQKISGLDEGFLELKVRLREVEQAAVGGFKSAPGLSGGKDSLASQFRDHAGFSAFLSGQTKDAKITIEGGLLAKNTILGESGSPQAPDRVLSPAQRMPGIVPGAMRQLRIRDFLVTLPTSTNLVEYTRELGFTSNAAPVPEGQQKPEADLTFELGEAPVKTIAVWLKVSKQALEDQPALQQFIDVRLRHAIELEAERQVLVGDGLGTNIAGLTASGNNVSYTDAESDDTHIDAMRRAMAQLQSADFEPTGHIIHPRDWARMELAKGGDGQYVLGRPWELQPPVLWGLPVVPTASIGEGDFLVSDFAGGMIMWDRQRATVELFEQDDDDVQHNLATVRAEVRVALTVLRPASVILGEFANGES